MPDRAPTVLIALLFLIGAGVAPGADYVPQPLPIHAPCGLACQALVPAYYERTMSERYRTTGHHDPAWDEPALALIAAWQRSFASGTLGQHAEDLRDLGEKALAAGCHDEWVLYLTGRSWSALGRHAEAEALFRRAWKALDASQGASTRAYLAYHLYLELLEQPDGDAGAQRAEQFHWFSIATAMARGMVAGDEFKDLPELAWVNIAYLFHENAEAHRAYLAAIADQVGKEAACDPWLAHQIRGAREVDLAWAARGNGYADSVTEAGWKGFRDHAVAARAELEEAQRLRPDLPYAATTLISVAMADGKDDPRAWFDRAVAARFDCVDAYINFTWSLMPRWGGSHQGMVAFGRECLATARFDTEVPLRYLEIQRIIIMWDEAKNPARWRDDPATADDLERLFAGMCAAVRADPAQLARYSAQRVAAATACGAKQRAVTLAKALGGPVPDEAWQTFLITPAIGRAILEDWASEQGARP